MLATGGLIPNWFYQKKGALRLARKELRGVEV